MDNLELSSKAKGDLFEAEVFEFIKDYVHRGETFLNPKKCQFFTQKGYYSHKRKSDIIVDISIETHIQSIEKISQLIIIECKNYGKRVPVDDIEEFSSKLEQIAGQKGKGFVFSRNGFSTGAIEFASTSGIALARLLPHEQVDWVLERTPKHVSQEDLKKNQKIEIRKALTIENYIGQSEVLFTYYNNSFSTSFNETFNKLISKNYNKDNQKMKERELRQQVPYLEQENIERRINDIINHFEKDKILNEYEVNIPFLCQYLSKKYDVVFQYDKYLGVNSQGKEILGKFEIENRKIFITSKLPKNSPRWRFTLSHELGHLLLHRKLYIPSLAQEHMDTSEILSWENADHKDASLIRLEWQANSFASSLLLPKDLVFRFIVNKLVELDVRNFSSGIIYLDEQQCNLETYRKILFDMTMKFNVSHHAANYRLEQLKILNNQTNQKSIRDLLRKLSIVQEVKNYNMALNSY